MNQTRNNEVIWTAEEIADLIDRLQTTYAAAATALLLLNDDDVLHLLRTKGYDRGTMIRLGRQDNTFYEGINLWDAINLVRQDHRHNLDFVGSYFMTILLFVGDKLRQNEYFDKTPELEFLRHLRNGVSHGNTFRLRDYGEPRRPATFKGFEITQELEGQSVLFEFIGTGDLFDLFDHIKAHLRALC